MSALTSDLAAVLKAVLDDPADDLPRMAYADLLEEAGRSDAARYIRGQIAGKVCRIAARLFRHWFDPSGSSPLPLLRHGRGWTRATLPSTCSLLVRRGFPESFRCTEAHWLTNGPSAVRLWPLERVELIGKRPYAVPDADEALFGWRHDLAGIRADPPGPAPTLDKRLWSALAGGDVGSRTPNWKDYPSEADARDALSDACLAWARSAPPAL